ncbi:MAG: hypothetical protein FWG73_07505 [Planctomycetaceae bacterium]|nr:hypothetical protein [Planctomycetaceae bacterium]
MTINTRELRRRIELDGADRTAQHLTEALKQGDLNPDDFSIRDLAESFMPGGMTQLEHIELLTENAGIQFVNTVGAVIDTKIKEAYNQEVFAASKLVRTIPTRLDGERIHGFGSVADGNLAVAPGDPYPEASMHADYIETPKTAKHGLIIPITKEAVFFDQTHHLLERAAEVGEILAMNKENRILKMVLGLEDSYKQNGVPYSTYFPAENFSAPWKNRLSDNELTDWESIEKAENLFGDMTDSISNRPILIEPNAVLVMPQKRHLAHRLFNATPISYDSNTVLRNPFAKYRLASSRLAHELLKQASPQQAPNAHKTWYIGNFRKAFAYMENWPITVAQSVSGSEADFTQDVVVRFKASERGVPAVLDPRYVVRCDG